MLPTQYPEEVELLRGQCEWLEVFAIAFFQPTRRKKQIHRHFVKRVSEFTCLYFVLDFHKKVHDL